MAAAKKKKGGAPKKRKDANPAAGDAPSPAPTAKMVRPPITPYIDSQDGLFDGERIERDIEPFLHKYFAQAADGNFIYPLDGLREVHGITDEDFDSVFNYVYCGYATDASGNPYHCRLCGKQVYFSTREDYEIFCKTLSSRGSTCEKCVAREDLKASMTSTKWKEYLIREKFTRTDHGREFFPSKDVNFLKMLISLKGIVMKGLSEDMDHIRPVSEYASSIFPGEHGLYALLKFLHKEKALFIHPGTNAPSVEFNGDEIVSYYTDKVFYMLPMVRGSVANAYGVITDELPPSIKASFASKLYYSDFWKELSLASALAYLERRLEEFSLSHSCGDKTIAVINDVLTTFSVSQVYNFIWRSTRDAAAFYMKGGVTKPHAANTVVGNIARQAERARAERWNVKKYGQDWEIGNPLICELLSLDLFGNATAWFDASLKDVKAAEERLAAWQPEREIEGQILEVEGSNIPEPETTEC